MSVEAPGRRSCADFPAVLEPVDAVQLLLELSFPEESRVGSLGCQAGTDTVPVLM